MNVERQEARAFSEPITGQEGNSLNRSAFISRFWKAPVLGLLGVVLGGGGEVIRQIKSNPVEGQTRREMLKSLNPKDIFKAASLGGSAGVVVGLVGSKRAKPDNPS